jgi:hypothetical protein
MSDWVDDIAKAMRKHQDSVLCRGLATAGPMFNFDRTIINPADIRLGSDGSSDHIVTKDPAIVEELLIEKLALAKAFFVLASSCSRCRMVYEGCACSTALDTGVFQDVTAAEPAFLFWTDRPAGHFLNVPVEDSKDDR